MKKIIFFIFLTSCSSTNIDNNLSIKNLSFDEDLSFNEFKNMLMIYSKRAKYPDLKN
jgi:hypothetical protein|tara:strand:+ start:360 stop:530 length:171 start_codon:yes stop_codon:yes gene_type:complete